MLGNSRNRRFISRAAWLVLMCAIAGFGVAGVEAWRTRGAAWERQPVSATPPLPRRVRIAAAGDVMLDRGVWDRIQRYGLSHVMSSVRDILRGADIAFVNLECPLSTVQGHARPGGSLVFCADPTTVQVLAEGGVDVVSLANNHAMDAGWRGCEDTMAVLSAHNIAYVGARPEGEAPDEITYLPAGDVLVAFLAYTDLDFEHQSLCKVDEDMQNVLGRVREARNRADVVCVSYHWGVEYQKEPTERQVKLGHATIDAGADIVLGHHPHVMSGVERYRNGLILYSMGNFVFDQRDADDGRMNSAIFSLDVTVGQEINLTITPFHIPREAYAPRPASEQRKKAILAELGELSRSLGTPLEADGQRLRRSFLLSPLAASTMNHPSTVRG